MDAYANPPDSPDFSIVDNILSILKQRVMRRHYFHKASMEQGLLEKWDKVSQKEINRLLEISRTQPCTRTRETRAFFPRGLGDIVPPTPHR